MRRRAARTAGGGKRHRDVPAHVFVGVVHPFPQARERGVGVRTDELVAYREGPEALAHVLLAVAQGRLDQVEERLGPFGRTRPRGVLCRDDDRAAQAAVGTAHPFPEKRDGVRPCLGQRLSQEGSRGLADGPVVVARQAIANARDLPGVRAGQRPQDEPGQFLVDAPGMRQKALGPVKPNPRRRAKAVDHFDREVVVILAHPAVHPRLP